jgi:ketosteroid isomerase-like protein
MSQENVEIVREGIEAWNQHDADLWLRNAAPDVEWMPAGPAAVEGTVYRGHDEVASGFTEVWQTWEVFHFEEAQIRDLGDSVLGSVASRCEEAPARLTSTRSSPFTFGCKTVRSSPFALS